MSEVETPVVEQESDREEKAANTGYVVEQVSASAKGQLTPRVVVTHRLSKVNSSSGELLPSLFFRNVHAFPAILILHPGFSTS